MGQIFLASLRQQLAEQRGLRAITLKQPWAWAILRAGKTVENRTWPLPWWARKQWIALHAGKMDRVEEKYDSLVLGKAGVVVPPPNLLERGVVGLVRFGEPFRLSAPASLWESGPWCWPVEAKWPLPQPVVQPGARKLWWLPVRTLHDVIRGLATAGGEPAWVVGCSVCGAEAVWLREDGIPRCQSVACWPFRVSAPDQRLLASLDATEGQAVAQQFPLKGEVRACQGR